MPDATATLKDPRCEECYDARKLYTPSKGNYSRVEVSCTEMHMWDLWCTCGGFTRLGPVVTRCVAFGTVPTILCLSVWSACWDLL